MLYIILIVSLCLNFIIICFLLLSTISLFLYQVGTTIILDCLLNQLLVFHSARINDGKFDIRFKGAVLWNNIVESLKTIRFYPFKSSLKKVSHYVILNISSLLESICSDINLVPRVLHLPTPKGATGGEMKDPGNEVVVTLFLFLCEYMFACLFFIIFVPPLIDFFTFRQNSLFCP